MFSTEVVVRDVQPSQVDVKHTGAGVAVQESNILAGKSVKAEQFRQADTKVVADETSINGNDWSWLQYCHVAVKLVALDVSINGKLVS